MAVTVAPYVNCNGTSREALLDGYRKAAEALHEALDALHATAPHGRDYQTAPAGRFRLAGAEHAARVNALSAVYEDLQALVEAVGECDSEDPARYYPRAGGSSEADRVPRNAVATGPAISPANCPKGQGDAR
jgi:hypothetical protein